jgi:hypothetical protein
MTIDSINLEGTRLASADSTAFVGAGAGLAVHPLFRPTDAQCQLLPMPRANTAPDGQHKRICDSLNFSEGEGKRDSSHEYRRAVAVLHVDCWWPAQTCSRSGSLEILTRDGLVCAHGESTDDSASPLQSSESKRSTLPGGAPLAPSSEAWSGTLRLC